MQKVFSGCDGSATCHLQPAPERLPLIRADRPAAVERRFRRPLRLGLAAHLAAGETVILLTPPSPFSRRFNRDDGGAPAK